MAKAPTKAMPVLADKATQNGYITATLGANWRKPREEGFVFPLPSGNVARLRPVMLDMLLAQGKVPDLLTGEIANMVFEGFDVPKIEAMMAPDNLVKLSAEWVELINTICTEAFLEPRIVDNPQADDEISIGDLELVDRGHVFSIAILPAGAMAAFFRRQSARMATLQDDEGDGDPAE